MTYQIDEQNINGTYEEVTCAIYLMLKKGHDVEYGSSAWEFETDEDRHEFETDLTECCEQINS